MTDDQTMAMGMLEVVGLVAAVNAADAMLKAAEVRLIGLEHVGAGLSTLVIEGDIAAVQAAVDAGRVSAEQTGTRVTRNVIGRPGEGVTQLFDRMNDPVKQPAAKKAAAKKATAKKATAKKATAKKVAGGRSSAGGEPSSPFDSEAPPESGSGQRPGGEADPNRKGRGGTS